MRVLNIKNLIMKKNLQSYINFNKNSLTEALLIKMMSNPNILTMMMLKVIILSPIEASMVVSMALSTEASKGNSHNLFISLERNRKSQQERIAFTRVRSHIDRIKLSNLKTRIRLKNTMNITRLVKEFKHKAATELKKMSKKSLRSRC